MKTTTLTATTALLATTALATTLTAASPRPNVIFFLIDDMGYGDLHYKGNYGVNTPNIDRLATEGLRVDHFYVSYPICSPSRTSYTTGQYAQRWGITSYLDNMKLNAERGMPNFLSLKAPTLARCLQNAGYATGHFGKWHMGGQRDFGDAPLITAYGFDESLTSFEGLGDRILPVFSPGLSAKNPKWINGHYDLGIMSEKLGHGHIEWVDRWLMTGRFIDRAITFIDKAKNTGKPFYVNIWPDDVHTPVEPSAPFRGDNSQHTRFQGVVRELDREFGRLMDYIRNDPALRDNTIVILASDNGPEKGAGSPGNLRGFKTELYEGGVREPFIIWAPKLLAPASIGTINNTSDISGLDFAPTLLSILRVPAPDGVKFDGVDMSDVFLGRSTAPYRPTPLFFSRPPDRPGAKNELPDFAVRDGKWKYYLHRDGREELYDVTDDPGEMLDKSKDNPAVIKTLRAKLTAWQKDVHQEKIFKAGDATVRQHSVHD